MPRRPSARRLTWGLLPFAVACEAGTARLDLRPLPEPLADVRLGMEQQELLALRGEGLEPLFGDEDDGVHEQIFFETVEEDGLEARVVYAFDPDAPVLAALQIEEEHPGSRMKGALERKVVEASSRWGAPTSFSVETLDGAEFVAVIWTVEGRFELAIDYPPIPSWDEKPGRLVTRFTNLDLSEHLAEQRLESADTISLEEERRRILGFIERAKPQASQDAEAGTE